MTRNVPYSITMTTGTSSHLIKINWWKNGGGTRPSSGRMANSTPQGHLAGWTETTHRFRIFNCIIYLIAIIIDFDYLCHFNWIIYLILIWLGGGKGAVPSSGGIWNHAAISGIFGGNSRPNRCHCIQKSWDQVESAHIINKNQSQWRRKSIVSCSDVTFEPAIGQQSQRKRTQSSWFDPPMSSTCTS